MGPTLLHRMLLPCFGWFARQVVPEPSGCSNAAVDLARHCEAHDWLYGRVAEFEAVSAR